RHTGHSRTDHNQSAVDARARRAVGQTPSDGRVVGGCASAALARAHWDTRLTRRLEISAGWPEISAGWRGISRGSALEGGADGLEFGIGFGQFCLGTRIGHDAAAGEQARRTPVARELRRT